MGCLPPNGRWETECICLWATTSDVLSGRALFYYISSPFTVFLLFLCLFYRFFAFFMRCVFLIGTGWELNEMGRSCLCEGVTPPPRTHPLCRFCSVFVLLILCEQFLFSQLQSIVALF